MRQEEDWKDGASLAGPEVLLSLRPPLVLMKWELGLVCGSAQLLSSAHVSSAAGRSQSDWISGQRSLWSLWS